MSFSILACLAAFVAIVALAIAMIRNRRTDECPQRSCSVSRTKSWTRKTGLLWLVGSFLICPCHLPITLGFLATVLSGTAVGALLTGHTYLAGSVITLAWAAGTWRGIRHLRLARIDGRE